MKSKTCKIVVEEVFVSKLAVIFFDGEEKKMGFFSPEEAEFFKNAKKGDSVEVTLASKREKGPIKIKTHKK